MLKCSFFLHRQVSKKKEENDDCESVHNLKDHQCVVQLNTRCKNVGMICKKKCIKRDDPKCHTNNLSEMQCDVGNGVCESTNRCTHHAMGTFRKNKKSADKCGRCNIFNFVVMAKLFKIFFTQITYVFYKFSIFYKVPHPPPETPENCCELTGVPENCQPLCRSGQSARYNNEYTIPSCMPYAWQIETCKGKEVYSVI